MIIWHCYKQTSEWNNKDELIIVEGKTLLKRQMQNICIPRKGAII